NPGEKAVADVIYMVNELKKMPFINQVALMGNGTGAGIILKAVTDSAIADVVVLQNLPYSLSRLIRRQAVKEWGKLIQPIMPVAIRSYERKTGIRLNQFTYIDLIKTLNIPHLFVTANFYSKKDIDDTVEMHKASTYYKKRIYIDTHTFRKPTGLNNDKKYYDKISTYINSSLPSKSKKTRFRKLAFQ
ncbi:MAG TPA: hypothetical protein PKD91_03060, partial [Bacteroidia bacterium]|nr:hypothetical protein [Bacteroidia bacterium]